MSKIILILAICLMTTIKGMDCLKAPKHDSESSEEHTEVVVAVERILGASDSITPRERVHFRGAVEMVLDDMRQKRTEEYERALKASQTALSLCPGGAAAVAGSTQDEEQPPSPQSPEMLPQDREQLQAIKDQAMIVFYRDKSHHLKAKMRCGTKFAAGVISALATALVTILVTVNSCPNK